ncbi:hypothetical protein JVV71_21705, partial [Vibrio cholerae O1]|nr:hypothetical protein [Vibrio cholerae O1]
RDTLDSSYELIDGRCTDIKLMDGLQATGCFIRDGMGSPGEADDGITGLGKQLIQLRKRSILRHQVLGAAR